MRIATKTIYDAVKFNLADITSQLNKANTMVASGKRIITPSDDPVGLNQALNIKSALSNLEQLGRNIDLGKSWLEASESALSQVRNLISDTKALTVQMAAVVEVGQNGTAVFGTLFTTLSDLKTALEGNNIGGIQNAMGNLDNHFNHISTEISDIGSKMIRMEIKENIYQDLSITNTSRLGEIEDVDMAEAILELKSIEVAYQAALASSSQVMRLSLVDYL
jgi:flagellin-like hook-associated protein FlgL